MVNARSGREGLDVIRKEACPFYRLFSGVRLCWELEDPKGPKLEQGRDARELAESAGLPPAIKPFEYR